MSVFSDFDERTAMRTRIIESYVRAAELSAFLSFASGPCSVHLHDKCDGIARPNNVAEAECLCMCHDPRLDGIAF